MKSFISIIFAAGIGFLGAKELPPVPELKSSTDVWMIPRGRQPP